MNAYEYHEAKKKFESQKRIVRRFKRNTPAYGKELSKFIELLITIRGHALCMDVKQERKKISRLVVNALMEI